jgi:hypothetical protein
MSKRGLLEGVNLPPAIAMPAPSQAYLSDPLGGFTKVLGGFLEGRQTDAAARQKAAIEEAAMAGDENALRALTQAGASNQAGLWDPTKLGEVQKAAKTALGTQVMSGITRDIDTAAREGDYNSFEGILNKLRGNSSFLSQEDRAKAELSALTGRETAAMGEIGKFKSMAQEERNLDYLNKAQDLLAKRQGIIGPVNEDILRTGLTSIRPDIIGMDAVRAGEKAFTTQLASTTAHNKAILQKISEDPIGRQYVDVDPTTGSIIPKVSPDPIFREAQADYLSKARLKQYDISGESLKVREKLMAAGLPMEKVEAFTGTLDKYKKLYTSLSGAGAERQANAYATVDADKNSKVAALDAQYKITELISNSTIKKLLDEKSFSSGALMEYANKLIPDDSGLVNSTIFTGKLGNMDVKEVLTGYLDNTGNKFTRAPSPLELKEALDSAKATRVWGSTPVVAMAAFDKFLQSKIAATDSEKKTLENEKPKIFEEIDKYYKTKQEIEATATREKMLATAGIYRDEGKPDIGLTNGMINSFTKAINRANTDEVATQTAPATDAPIADPKPKDEPKGSKFKPPAPKQDSGQGRTNTNAVISGNMPRVQNEIKEIEKGIATLNKVIAGDGNDALKTGAKLALAQLNAQLKSKKEYVYKNQGGLSKLMGDEDPENRLTIPQAAVHTPASPNPGGTIPGSLPKPATKDTSTLSNKEIAKNLGLINKNGMATNISGIDRVKGKWVERVPGGKAKELTDLEYWDRVIKKHKQTTGK